jgi:CubicO group peptidase (beta-lactamase class C family)
MTTTPVVVALTAALVVTLVPGRWQQSVSPFPTAKPEDVGVPVAALEEMKARLRSWIEQGDAVGAELLVIKKRRTVLHETFGLADLDDGTRLGADTIVCIRSMTKPIVGTAVQILIDEGRLSLDDTAAKYLPSFANIKSERVTIRQLLTHTAGFPITLINRPLSSYARQRDIADQAGAIGPSSAPGAFSYSDTDVETLTAIVGQVAGEPAEAFIKRRVLDPLGMTDTFAVLAPDAPPRARVSSNHAGAPAAWHKYWDNEDPPFFPFFLGAAGMYSTVTDYARFLALWMDRGVGPRGRIISEAAVSRALEPLQPLTMPQVGPMPTRFPKTELFYGQLWTIFRGVPAPAGSLPAFGHSGSDGTAAWAFPDQDLMVLLFTQSRGGISVIRFERFIAPLVGLPAPDVPTLQRPTAAQLTTYPGAYRFESRRVFVVQQQNRLAVQVPEAQLTLRWPDPQGRWAYEGFSGDAVRFVTDASGRPTGFELSGEGRPTVLFKRLEPLSDLIDVGALMRLRREKQGGDAIDRIGTLVMTGTLTVGGVTGPVTISASRSGQYSTRRILAGVTEDAETDSAKGVRRATPGDTTPLTGVFLEQAQLNSPLVRLGDWRQSYGRVEVIARETMNGEDVWVVRVTPREVPPSTRYVSVTTGLLLKDETWLTVRGVGMVPFALVYSDYRPVSGVLLPFRIETRSTLTGVQVTQYSDASIR